MDPERWKRIKRIYDKALQVELSPKENRERIAFQE